MGAQPRIRNAILVLAAVVIIGTIGYMAIERWSFFDAIYMTIITVSTVGYREVHELSPAGQAFTLFLIVTGVGSVLYGLTAIMQYVVEGQFGGAVWRRRMKTKIDALHNHFVLCGYGRVGRQIAAEFKNENVPFVVIDINQESLMRCGQDGNLYVPGDATSDQVLIEAGIDRARGLVTAIDDDALNVYVTLSARGMRPDLLIVARADREQAEAKLRRAGADRVVSPYSNAGRRMAMSALRPVVIDFVETVVGRSSLELLLESYEVGEISPFLGMTIGQARARRDTVASLLAVQKKNGPLVLPKRDDETRIELGDQIIFIGTQTELAQLDVATPLAERDKL